MEPGVPCASRSARRLIQFIFSRVRASTSDNDDGDQHQGNHHADPKPDAHTDTTYPEPGVCFGAPSKGTLKP
jgi:hypothetical protein